MVGLVGFKQNLDQRSVLLAEALEDGERVDIFNGRLGPILGELDLLILLFYGLNQRGPSLGLEHGNVCRDDFSEQFGRIAIEPFP